MMYSGSTAGLSPDIIVYINQRLPLWTQRPYSCKLPLIVSPVHSTRVVEHTSMLACKGGPSLLPKPEKNVESRFNSSCRGITRASYDELCKRSLLLLLLTKIVHVCWLGNWSETTESALACCTKHTSLVSWKHAPGRKYFYSSTLSVNVRASTYVRLTYHCASCSTHTKIFKACLAV